jgi:hypothetical protein
MLRGDFHRQSLLLTLLLLGVAALSAQEIGKRYQGSAPALDGNIYVLTYYVTETEWTDEEAEWFYGLVLEAEDWLVKQALEYGKEVSFENGIYGIDKPLLMSNIVSGNGSGDEPVDIVSKVMTLMGFDNGLDFVSWVKSNTDCTSCLVLIVANKPGRGYSMAYKNLYSLEKYFLEGSMLYTGFESGKPACAAGIAHEMCHLFGAEDLYETFVQTKENEERARELFPDDIMLSTSYNINKRKIDRLTAWFIGLTDEMEDWYTSFLYKPKD